MNIFKFRDELIKTYSAFSQSFTKILSEDIRQVVEKQCNDLKRYWPEPLLQINPCYQQGKTISEYVQNGILHPLCERIFTIHGKPIRLYLHQEQAISMAEDKKSYVVTTGTGSGKSLSFFIPIIDRILREKSASPLDKPRTRAIVLYPMNALANSQKEEIEKFLKNYQGAVSLTVGRYTGQEGKEERQRLQSNPPDILLTNYMMLELVLMRHDDRPIVDNCEGLEFLVLDELHTYRGRQGADVAMLVRRLRSQLKADKLICIGTSATMSSVGSRAEQNTVVAKFASTMFGTQIDANQVIGETLVRVTNPRLASSHIKPRLTAVVRGLAEKASPLSRYEDFKDHPLAVWLELNLSITDQRTRAIPLSVREVVSRLSNDAAVDEKTAESALKNFLSQFGGEKSLKTDTGKNPFPFKLHQFISGPGKVYVTLAAPGKRNVTLDGQTYSYDPEHPEQRYPLFEAYFCRNCGQEYIPVWIERRGGIPTRFSPRNIDELSSEEASFGYLVPATPGQAWQGEDQSEMPAEWVDDKNPDRVKSAHRKKLPLAVQVLPTGQISGTGAHFWLLTGKFRFCVNCLETHSARGKDKHRLIGLSGEGRSSATTEMTMQILRQLYAEKDVAMQKFRKVLGFADNRQDAALQAGHFNDFINQVILRSGVICVLREIGGKALTLPDVVSGICKLFHFDDPYNKTAQQEYLNDVISAENYSFNNANKALRFVLSYRILRDLQDKGFYNCPSLERLGLLRIGYSDLNRVASDDTAFAGDPVLSKLTADNRSELFATFLNEVRRRLCIDSVYFSPQEQERMRELDHGVLSDRWSLADEMRNGVFEGCAFVLRKEDVKSWQGDTARLTVNSPVMKVLQKLGFWKEIKAAIPENVSSDRVAMHDLVTRMTRFLVGAGFLRQKHNKGGTCYQLDQNVLTWSFPKTGKTGVNEFFQKLYLTMSDVLKTDGSALFDFEAEEHTAQVSSEEREDLEMRFRATQKDEEEWKKKHPSKLFKRLPLLFCSPTMELGIDISSLNYVYMRNIPPTAANYVQRAGRAGRSGQQAMSVSYCASMSPHDQWFFNHPEDMVQGVVKEPTLDLSNEALIKNHLHSIWMSAACVDLPGTVAQALDLTKVPDYPVLPDVLKSLQSEAITKKAVELGKSVLAQVASELKDQRSTWYDKDYVERTMNQSAKEFQAAFDGWRSLYNATRKQIQEANDIILGTGYSKDDLAIASYRHQDARRQKQKLEQTTTTSTNNEFYTYRYLASQGFLPGYSFSALPLLAWLPAPNGQTEEDTVLARGRFLGLSEFGPRNLIYHRGRIYRIERLKINVTAGTATADVQLPTLSVIVCSHCGYAHDLDGDKIFNVCENCGMPLSLDDVVQGLYKVSMVEAKEVEHITVEDENRRSQGFETQTLFRFAKSPVGKPQTKVIEVKNGDKVTATLTYAPAASVWRANLGWKHRKNQKTKGFVINPITGYWRNEGPDAEETKEKEDKVQDKGPVQTIVPFVSDTRNILLLEPKIESATASVVTMATLQAAIKRAIEQVYQVESSEIFVEPIPNALDRRMILIYESGEGGAGVLRNLVKNPNAMKNIAEAALELMHYEKNDGQSWDADHMEQFDRKTDCVAGCYSCLLTYYNQPEHNKIDRRDPDALRFLVSLTQCVADVDESAESEAAVQTEGTTIERFKAKALAAGFKVPDQCPKTFKRMGLTFDAAYSGDRTLISFSPVDDDVKEDVQEIGWKVLDMSDESQWETTLRHCPELLAD